LVASESIADTIDCFEGKMGTANPLRILFVEDLPSDTELAEREIRKSGLEFSSQRVDTKDAFLKALEVFRPDVIVSDYSMPEFDGMQALKLTLERDARLPFILLTGSMNEETAVACMKAGASDYVIKEHMTRLSFAVRDALEQKRIRAAKNEAERALRESEEKFRRVVETALEGVWFLDHEFKTTEVNEAVVRMLGYSPDELIGRPFVDLLFDEDRSTQAQEFQRRETGLSGQYEKRLLCKDGGVKWLFLSAKAVMNTAGAFEGSFAMVTDITERKRAEEQITLLAHTVKSVIECVSVTDLDDTVLFVNEAFLATYGYDEHELLGKNIKIVRSPNTPQELVREIRAATLAAGWHGELLNRTKEGREFPVSLSTSFVRNNSGQPIALVGVATDITERKRAEETLQESEQKYRGIFENIQDVYYESAIDGTILEVSPSIEILSKGQYCREDLIGKSMYVFYADPGERKALLVAIQARGRVSDFEISLTNRDGSRILCSISAIIRADAQGRPEKIMGSLRDITERKKAEQNLRFSEERFRSVWDNSADGMRLTDKEGRIIGANEAFSRLVNVPCEKLVGEIFSLVYEKGGSDGDIRIYKNRFDSREIVPHLQAAVTLWSGKVLELDISNSFIETEGEERMVLSIFHDITEQKHAERRLLEERNLLRTIIDAIPDEIGVKDNERRFLVVNSGTVKAFKRASADEFIGKKDEDLIPEHLVKRAIEVESTVLAVGGHSRDWVATKIDPDTGEIERSQQVSKIPLKDHEGKIIGLVGINRDITEYKRAQELLEKERTLLLTLIENIPDEVCLKDLSHRYLVANSASMKALGVKSLSALIGKTDLDLVGHDLAQEHIAEENAILQSGEPLINRERTKIDPNTGEIEKCLLTTKVPVKDQTGKTIGILVINRYITERRRAEEALRASEEKFRALFEESKDAVYISTVDGKLMDINAAGIELLGYQSKQELLDIDLGRDSYIDAERREQFRKDMEQRGFVKDFEYVLRRKGGEQLTVLETATAVRDKQGAVVLYRGIIRDVTRQRQLELQFLQAQKMESIGTLAGGIAHDFNNILGIVLGHLALLERTRNNDAQFEESIFSINKAVERGASLVRQILTFARKAETQLEPVNINSVIKELAKMIEETFPKTIAVTLQLDKTIPVVSMDPTQLHQTMLNLCVNARDAMEGTGTLTIATHLVLGRDVSSRFPKASASHYVQVSAVDTGSGMDEMTKQRIFEPFFTTKGEGKGTGLGLAVVYGVLQAHNGFVDVETALGHGTAFHLFFPVPEGILRTSEKQTVPQEDLPRGTETILVVEDEDVLRDLLVKLLEMQGYSVIPACDGEEAVMRFSEHAAKIDLVLSDMGLPKRSGWDAFRMMQKINSKVRILLASGYIEPGQKLEILKSRAVRFIHKPYKMEEILVAVRETLDKKK
jgi:PAS domain S-box-containing protein